MSPKTPAVRDDEYTGQQRRTIDARLDKALNEVKQGRTHGPFETHEEMMKFLNRRAAKPGKKAIKSNAK